MVILEKENWRKLVQRLVKTEMTARGLKYQDISQRLATLGIEQSADNLRNKVNRGIMGADLLLQILCVIEARPVSVETLRDMLKSID